MDRMQLYFFYTGNVIVRTTTYDGRSGGFVTSVSTENISSVASEEAEQEQEVGGDTERLVLSHHTYNTLNKTQPGKKTVSFHHMNPSIKRKMDFADSQSKYQQYNTTLECRYLYA